MEDMRRFMTLALTLTLTLTLTPTLNRPLTRFMAVDTDGSATIDFDEFVSMQSTSVSSAFSVEEMRAVYDKVWAVSSQ